MFDVWPLHASCSAEPDTTGGIDASITRSSDQRRILRVVIDRIGTWTVTVRCAASGSEPAQEQVKVVIIEATPPTTTPPLSYRDGWRTRTYEDRLTNAERMYATVDGNWLNAEFPYEDHTPQLAFFCAPGSRNLTVYIAGLGYIAEAWRRGIPVAYRINDGPAQYEQWNELTTNEGAWGGTSSLLPRNLERSGADRVSLYVEITNFDSTEERLRFRLSRASESITSLRDACERGRF